MTDGLRTIIYPVKDVAKAKALFRELLGVEPTVDEPYYVGFEVGGQHVGLDPHGHGQGMTAPVGYWHVAEIGRTLEALAETGAVVNHQITDVGEGKLIASVKDADGNVIGLIQEPE